MATMRIKMNIKYWLLVCILGLGIILLGLDKCGSTRKADELKGEYKKASEIAKVERLIKEEVIEEQKEKIEVLNTTIEVKNTTIAKKERNNIELGNTVADLEKEFDNLTDKDEKIENLIQQVEVWKEKFSLSQGIIADKDDVIFSLNEKYDAQVVISTSYKDMYESVQGLIDIRTKQVKELEKINKRLRFSSGIKTGVAIGLAGLVIYSLLKD